MMTRLCPDAPGATPTTVDAVDAQGTLTTTAGNRLKMLLSLVLLGLATSGLVHHARHHRDNKHGQWANATETDEIPAITVPCSVDLPELLEAAGVTGVDAGMVLREHGHGCCGDEICALGEDADNCAADCTDGTTGNLVWQYQERRHHDHDHDHRHHGSDNDEHDDTMADADHDEDNAEAVDGDDELLLGDQEEESERGHREHGRRSHGHSRIGKLIVSVAMGVVGLALLISIRQSWVAIFRDFYTFLCPSCGRAKQATLPQQPLNAIAVGAPSSEKDQAEIVSTV
jgi:hypothetical protein|eukprot:COSAG02_NODE_2554_length_8538_cov_46.619268_7_plen_286_part_00